MAGSLANYAKDKPVLPFNAVRVKVAMERSKELMARYDTVYDTVTDEFVRLPREMVLARAEEVFGDKKLALEWLETPCYSLGNKIPLELIETTEGRGQVVNMLGRIKHGIFL